MNSYEKKLPEDFNCGLTVFTKFLGAKWKACIIDAINRGWRRPSEMHRQIADATPRVLDMQLRELELHGIVRKSASEGFPLKAEYFLTEIGLSALPVISLMDGWGTRHAGHAKALTGEINTMTVDG